MALRRHGVAPIKGDVPSFLPVSSSEPLFLRSHTTTVAQRLQLMKAAQTRRKPMFMDEPRPEELLTEQIFTCRVLSINRPDTLNALNATLARKVSRAMDKLTQGAVTPFFVLEGGISSTLNNRLIPVETDRFFCTGTDLLALTTAWDSGDHETVKEYHVAEAAMVSSLVNCTRAWAAGMNGATLGAGTGLAMHALFRFASQHTTWSMPETQYGSVPGYGSSYQLHILPGNMGTYLALTGRRLVGQDLIWAGVASNLVEPASYEDVCSSITHQNSNELQHIMPVVTSFDVQRPLTEVPYALEPHLDTIATCFGEDSVERIMEKLREVGSPFAMKTLQKLESCSPAALKLTLRLLREGEQSDDLNDCLTQEYAVRMRLWEDEGSDLHYGLTHVVFGKTPRLKPQWPKAATDEYVESMFAPMAEGLGSLLELKPLAPRSPLEAPQLLQHHSDILAINRAPARTEEEDRVERKRLLEEAPVVVEELRPAHELMEEALLKNMHKLLRPVRNWFVQPAVDVPPLAPEVAAIVETASPGELLVATNARTGDTLEVPDAIKRELISKFRQLRDWRVFFVDTYEPHQSISYSSEQTVAHIDAALRQASGLPERADGFPKDRIVSSESMEEILARPFMSADDEIEAYLELAGFKHRDEDTLEEEFLAKGREEQVVDRTPLTERERQL
jgi:enoyl-CoA hydratase/carnithine racemase